MKVDSSSFGLYILVTEKKAQLMKRKELLLLLHPINIDINSSQ